MQDTAVIRLTNDGLAWYPPGASDEPRPLKEDADFEGLRALLDSSRSPVVFAAPGTAVRLDTLPYQTSEKRHVMGSLPFLFEEQLAEDIDGLHFAAVPQSDEQLAVAIVRDEDMEDWQALLAPCGNVPAWLPEPLLLPWQSGEWCVLIEGDSALVRTGAYAGFVIETDLLSALLAAQLAQDDTAPAPAQVVVYGADQAADLEHLPEALRESAQWRRGDFAAALMLRAEESEPLNLLQAAYAPRLPLRRWWQHWRIAAGVLLGAVLLQLVATWSELSQLESQNLALRQQVEASYRRAVPRGNAPDPERQISRKLAELRGTDSSTGFVSLIGTVGGAVNGVKSGRIASINYNARSGDLRMNIEAADYEAVEAIRLAIANQGLEATMESSNAQDGKVRARMRVKS